MALSFRHLSLCALAASAAFVAGCGGGGGGGGGGTNSVGPTPSGDVDGAWSVSSGADVEDPRMLVLTDDSLGGQLLIGRWNSTFDSISDTAKGVTVTSGGFTYQYQVNSDPQRTYHVTSMNSSELHGTRQIGSATASELSGGNGWKPSALTSNLAGWYDLDDGDFFIGLRQKPGAAGTWQLGELVEDGDDDVEVWYDATVNSHRILRADFDGDRRVVVFVSDTESDLMTGFFIFHPGDESAEAIPMFGPKSDAGPG